MIIPQLITRAVREIAVEGNGEQVTREVADLFYHAPGAAGYLRRLPRGRLAGELRARRR